MNELNLLFENAVQVFLQPNTGQYRIPVIGIAFANGSIPNEVSKILNSRNSSYDLIISVKPVLLCINAIDYNTKEVVFVANLNYDEAEVEIFRNLLNEGERGGFVVGGLSNCQFYVLTKDQDNFKPFPVESISFQDIEK